MKSKLTNPITKTLSALALGAAMLTSTQGCVSQRVGSAINQIGQAADDMSGKRYLKTKITTADDWSEIIKNNAIRQGVDVISTCAQYDICLRRSFEVPIFLATYSRFDNNGAFN